MKIKLSKPQSAKGFTLIEMIGVLAVIAILASLLIPKIFEAINNARVNNAAVSIQTVKTAVADHYAKFGVIPVDGTLTPGSPGYNLTLPYSPYDLILLKEGFVDKPFKVKIGDGTETCYVVAASLATADVAMNDGRYNLDGNATVLNEASGSHVVEVRIPNVALEDARALNKLIDGAALSADATTAAGTDTLTQDFTGRVKFQTGANGLATVNVYLTHR